MGVFGRGVERGEQRQGWGRGIGVVGDGLGDKGGLGACLRDTDIGAISEGHLDPFERVF